MSHNPDLQMATMTARAFDMLPRERRIEERKADRPLLFTHLNVGEHFRISNGIVYRKTSLGVADHFNCVNVESNRQDCCGNLIAVELVESPKVARVRREIADNTYDPPIHQRGIDRLNADVADVADSPPALLDDAGDLFEFENRPDRFEPL